MDFVSSNFGTNEPQPVEHTENWPKSEEKSVQLAEVHLYWTYSLLNLYFDMIKFSRDICTTILDDLWPNFKESQMLFNQNSNLQE